MTMKIDHVCKILNYKKSQGAWLVPGWLSCRSVDEPKLLLRGIDYGTCVSLYRSSKVCGIPSLSVYYWVQRFSLSSRMSEYFTLFLNTMFLQVRYSLMDVSYCITKENSAIHQYSHGLHFPIISYHIISYPVIKCFIFKSCHLWGPSYAARVFSTRCEAIYVVIYFWMIVRFPEWAHYRCILRQIAYPPYWIVSKTRFNMNCICAYQLGRLLRLKAFDP